MVLHGQPASWSPLGRKELWRWAAHMERGSLSGHHKVSHTDLFVPCT